jgi:hypothetical protein
MHACLRILDFRFDRPNELVMCPRPLLSEPHSASQRFYRQKVSSGAVLVAAKKLVSARNGGTKAGNPHHRAVNASPSLAKTFESSAQLVSLSASI